MKGANNNFFGFFGSKGSETERNKNGSPLSNSPGLPRHLQTGSDG